MYRLNLGLIVRLHCLCNCVFIFRALGKAPASQAAIDLQANGSHASNRRARPRPLSLTPSPVLSQARPFPMAGPLKDAVIDAIPIDIEDSEPSDDDIVLPPPAFLSQSYNRIKSSQQDGQLSQMREKMFPKYEVCFSLYKGQ